MLDKLFLHLVQYADELKNSSCPSIECGVFKGLEHMHISHTNEPSLTMEYRTPSPIDLSSSFSSHSELSNVKEFEKLDPVNCLKHSSSFYYDDSTLDSSASFCFDQLTRLNAESESSVSVAESSIGESIESSDPFGLSNSANSRISSSESLIDESATRKSTFDPFADSIFYDTNLSASVDLNQEEKGYWGESTGEEDRSYLVPSLESESILRPTNIFVANFPSHWSKSDLWDLFEGIPVTTVHVLPDKRVKNENSASGGTGFVNVTRSSDARALLSMLDKKIWLIDGSALKFRLANSSAPSDPVNFHEPKNVRTLRRHQHKVLDRLKAEQTIGSKQVGACDRHQIVVYQNSSSSGPGNATLSVVHSSRQRSNYFACAPAETTSRVQIPHRPLLDFLRSQLNRWNNYNSQNNTPCSTRQNGSTIACSPEQKQINKVPAQELKNIQATINLLEKTNSQASKMSYIPVPTIPNSHIRIVEVQGPVLGTGHQIALAPHHSFYLWSPDTNQSFVAYHQTTSAQTYALNLLSSIELQAPRILL
ncbi:hypothetical protein PPACK8108_LOCUS20860 [Phakopsora pachyrhizi]|uniref:RRM domain-containing protein n=1 Tax=Phakopsora pachyrhizi TaxID=170000 RepID=A0AAV0BJE6_PHAPC|nr:hypothetical protein PPACK8108_LOCUS20860 [Phakopsora pachyrhizi]